jgi:hypothetical protein
MQMASSNNPFEFIDTVINPIPVVGPLWADALYTVLGLSDAFNLRHFNDPYAPVPDAKNILEFTAKPGAEPLSRAA